MCFHGGVVEQPAWFCLFSVHHEVETSTSTPLLNCTPPSDHHPAIRYRNKTLQNETCWLIYHRRPYRHQRATLQMCQMSIHVCATRPPPATRPNRTCQRWRSAARQRSQTATGHQSHAQDNAGQASSRGHGHGYRHIGTNRSKQ